MLKLGLAPAVLEAATGKADVAAQAELRAAKLSQTIEAEYSLPQGSFYAFSRNENGTTDDTATIFPAVAWWDGTYSLQHTDPMMQRWASSEFSTDWGTRILSDRTRFYDPISYHQGSVWPLFTGWVSVAEYRAGHPLAGYAHLMQNADLTWAQDPGSVTELLSGQFYQVLGRSTAHQLWSSAMVISPVLRGLFGLEWDAVHHTLTVTPHLPGDWKTAAIKRIPFGDAQLDLSFRKQGQLLTVTATGPAAAGLHLATRAEGARADHNTLRIPLAPVEVFAEHTLPAFGEETHQLKVLNEHQGAHSLALLLAAPRSTTQTLSLCVNAPQLRPRSDDAALMPVVDGRAAFTVDFSQGSPDADGYVQKTVTIRW